MVVRLSVPVIEAACAQRKASSGAKEQSPRRNHLHIAQKGGHVPTVDHGVNASRAAFSLGGAAVYAAFFEGGMGYRNDNTSEVATGEERVCDEPARDFVAFLIFSLFTIIQ